MSIPDDNIVKTIKINENIHNKLRNVGQLGERYEDVILRLIDYYSDYEHTILKVFIDEKEDKVKVHIKNPIYYWTDNNYIKFLTLAFGSQPKWKENILRIIANNDEWYDKIEEYRKSK